MLGYIITHPYDLFKSIKICLGCLRSETKQNTGHLAGLANL